MPRFAFTIAIIFSAWRWSDWRNWEKYYGTILFFMANGLLYDVLYANYPLWRLEPYPPTSYILYSSAIVSLFATFVLYPATTLIYLSNLPSGNKKYLHILLWTFIYSCEEFIAIIVKGISYYNGWGFGWSVLFNAFLFSVMQVHQKKPLVAWGLCLISTICIFIKFGFPLE